MCHLCWEDELDDSYYYEELPYVDLDDFRDEDYYDEPPYADPYDFMNEDYYDPPYEESIGLDDEIP